MKKGDKYMWMTVALAICLTIAMPLGLYEVGFMLGGGAIMSAILCINYTRREPE